MKMAWIYGQGAHAALKGASLSMSLVLKGPETPFYGNWHITQFNKYMHIQGAYYKRLPS